MLLTLVCEHGSCETAHDMVYVCMHGFHGVHAWFTCTVYMVCVQAHVSMYVMHGHELCSVHVYMHGHMLHDMLHGSRGPASLETSSFKIWASPEDRKQAHWRAHGNHDSSPVKYLCNVVISVFFWWVLLAKNMICFTHVSSI